MVPRARPAFRSALALCASIVIHLLVASFLRWVMAPRPDSGSVVIELEAAPVDVNLAPEAPVQPSAAAASRPPASISLSPPRARLAKSQADEPSEHAPASSEPLESQGGPLRAFERGDTGVNHRIGTPNQGVDLSLSSTTIARIIDRRAFVSSGDRALSSLPGRSEDASQRVQSIVSDLAAQVRAEIPSSDWTPAKDHMRIAFDAKISRLDSVDGSRASLGSSLGAVFSGFTTDTHAGAAGSLAANASQKSQWVRDDVTATVRREVVALVKVMRGPDGRTVDVAVVQSSGQRSYDDAAVECARNGTGEVADTSTWTQSRGALWAFVTTLEVNYPVPGAGCALDALARGDLGACGYPLKRSSRTRVELRGVY